MAGYIFSMNSLESIEECFKDGVYGTIFNEPKKDIWGTPHEGTFADYASMKEGDYVFFFNKRRIHGVGKLKNISSSTGTSISDCKFLNFPTADEPQVAFVPSHLYLNMKSTQQRFICTFEPAPKFYHDGIDMDDALSSAPNCFKMLRAFWKLSFIKLDNDEAECLFNSILKKCYFNSTDYSSNYKKKHIEISKKISNNYLLNSKNILKFASNGDKLKHEMALEAGLIDQITKEDTSTIDIFGKWDYISHQVIASPFKAIDYMDKIDVYGYSYIEGYKTKNKYVVMELKKDTVTKDDVQQLMKYVDWVKDEYAGQDYSSIKAYFVAYEFESDVKEYITKFANRNYTIGRRPIVSGTWNDITLVKYIFNNTKKRLDFKNI